MKAFMNGLKDLERLQIRYLKAQDRCRDAEHEVERADMRLRTAREQLRVAQDELTEVSGPFIKSLMKMRDQTAMEQAEADLETSRLLEAAHQATERAETKTHNVQIKLTTILHALKDPEILAELDRFVEYHNREAPEHKLMVSHDQ